MTGGAIGGGDRAPRIDMTHGGGGRATAALVRDLFWTTFASPALDRGEDAGRVPLPGGRLVMTTDAHVISPLFFPGGDIGALAVHGTVNDLAMMGAQPVCLTASFILEEGFEIAALRRIAESMAAAAREAGAPIVAGDTKVVERGKGDGLFITTAGLGMVAEGVALGAEQVRPGQAVLVSGTMGDHGVAVLSRRENLAFDTEVRSDSAALNGLVAAMLRAAPGVAMMRDPTRGGLAATLNEIAAATGLGILIDEAATPVAPDVAAACELLGLDPLHCANEGKLVAICPADDADALLAAMRAHPLGRDAARIGVIATTDPPLVQLRSAFGGTRILDWLNGEQLPRIC